MSEAPPPAPQQPAYGAPPPAGGGQPTNVLAIISLILGIVALVMCCPYCFGTGTLAGIAALITGYFGLNKAKETGSGKGLAMAGLICGGISVALNVISLIIVIVAGGAGALMENTQ